MVVTLEMNELLGVLCLEMHENFAFFTLVLKNISIFAHNSYHIIAYV